MTHSCDQSETVLLSLSHALERIDAFIQSVEGVEQINLSAATGRILAETITAPLDTPPARVSAMDGYAISSNDIKPEGFSLIQAGTSWAGRPFEKPLAAGQCVRIFTGAIVPEQADSIIIQEQVTKTDSTVQFPVNCMAGQYIRDKGSDIKKGQILLPANKKLSPIDCALLASVGIRSFKVKRKINIAFFSTGDEIKSPGQCLQPGQIYNSNRYALAGFLQDSRFSITDMGIVADDKSLLKQTLLSTTEKYDVIITTGGASVGDADYMAEILAESGQVNFWKLAIKPGKPLAFGNINSSLYFGLPGNPVSSIVTFQKIVSPALDKLSGSEIKQPLQLQAVCQSDIKKIPGRQEFQRGLLVQHGPGNLSVSQAGGQDSHHLNALSQANCYIVLPADCRGVKKGETVIVEPFSAFL